METCSGSVLNQSEIEARCKEKKPLIYPFRSENIKGASYDLRLGRYARVGKVTLDLDNEDQTLRIPPYEVAYVESEEILYMPTNLVASFGLRMAWVFRGIIIPPQTQIDPGYHGRIFILLLNLSKSDVFIGRNEHIISIEFRRTADTISLTSPRQGVMSLKDALRGIPPVESGLAGLAKDIHRVGIRVERALLITLTLVTLLLTIITVIPLVKEFLPSKEPKVEVSISTPKKMPASK